MEFILNERLAAGGFEITRKYGCRILLKNEGEFPVVHPRSRSAGRD